MQAQEGFVGVGVQWRDGHQPDELQPVRGRDGSAQFVNGIRAADIHSSPRLVAVEAELEVNAQRLGPAALLQRLAGCPIQRGDQLGAVNGVRRIRPIRDRARFVALNPSDHVPANRLRAQHRTDFRAFI